MNDATPTIVHAKMYKPPFSLLQYDEAILVEASEKAKGALPESKPTKTTAATSPSHAATVASSSDPIVAPEILKAMLPSREWRDEHGKWQQNVSMTPSSRAQEHLAAQLTKEQAKKLGICANRERLHAQLFDEIIRQVTLACPERGLLLLRVRDEMHMTIDAYQALYNTSLSFGVRKTVLAEEGTQAIETRTQALEAEIAHLQRQVLEWSHRSVVLQQHYDSERDKLHQHQANVINALEAQIRNFETFRDAAK
ncbi:28 kDa inner dynein arm light chain, axonemal [Aphanomyces cochlioides]|nr:28 kDa inner dynein arm light chain, axonemal [Aphanomyces cochlioides]